MIIVLSFATWFVAVFALHLFLRGNPARTLIKSTPQPVLVQAMSCLEEAEVPEDEDSYLFLRRFYWLKMLRAGVFLIEGLTLIYFLLVDPYLIVPWILVLKNLVVYQVLYRVHYQREDGPIKAMQKSPPWAERLDRGSQLVTGVGFLLLFFRTHELV